MLRIITGTDRSNKTQTLAGYVKESIKNGRNVLILIPDQFSLIYDRKLYDILGAKDFNRVSIFGPERLAKRLVSEHPDATGQYCDENQRLIMLHKACKAFSASGNVRYFKKSLGKAEFFKNTALLFTELRQSDISPADLMSAEGTLQGIVSDKLSDIANLYKLYDEELISHGLKDINSATAEASQIIAEYKIFEGYDFYIDSFSGFSFDQLIMLSAIFAQSNDIVASLTIGGEANLKTNLTPFATTLMTSSKLCELAKKSGHSIATERALENGFKSCDIKHISDNVFCPDASKTQSCGDVKIISAYDGYSQAEYVFAQIARLVREEGFSYGEIAVISRSLDEGANLLVDMAKRFDVPVFIDKSINVSQSAPVLFINSVFESITSQKFSSKTLLNYIKSPLSDTPMWEASLIEEYIFKWSIDGDMWLSDFTASSYRDTERKNAELKKINEIRRKIITPLCRLKEMSENTTADKISVALNEFLRGIEINDKTFSDILSAQANSDATLETSRIFKQLWTMFLSSITSIFETLHGEEMTLKEYYELLKAMLSQMQISSPPQKLDAVICAGAEHSRLSGIRATFIIDVNDGVFPKTVRTTGLFTDREKAMLQNADIVMEKRLESSIQNERLVCFNALTSASERLYILYPLANDKGEKLRPSQLVSQICDMFTDDISTRAKDMPLKFYCATKKSAFYKYSELAGSEPALALSIREALCSDSEYREKFRFIDTLESKSPHALSPDVAKKLFFEKPLALSSTKMDSYHTCPFSYFCKFGLGIAPPRKVELSAPDSGSITHECLELIMTEDSGTGRIFSESFLEMSDDRLKEGVSDIVDKYIENNMGGDFGKNATFSANVAVLKEKILLIVKNIRDELLSTDFRPEAFEFSLTENGRSILPMFSSSGSEIDLRGYVDRIDLLTQGDKCYVRVIDYKTGSKSFKYRDVYNGLNQQMIIYLLAITTTLNSLTKGRELIPAGIIYMNAYEDITPYTKKQLVTQTESGVLEQKLQEKRDKAFKRHGVILDDMDVAISMDKELSGRFSPVVIKKPRSKKAVPEFGEKACDYTLTLAQLQRLCGFTKETIVKMADSLEEGKIEAVPRCYKLSEACQYCDYGAVCGNSEHENAALITEADKEKLLQIIRSEDNGTEGNDDAE